MAWLQGLSNAPEHVQKIVNLWIKLNPGWELQCLEQHEVDSIILDLGINPTGLTPQVKTDLARTQLLVKYGGVWADASLLPIAGLDEWLHTKMASGFFAYTSTGDPNLVLQNWFLAANKGNELVSLWLENYVDYFDEPRIYPTLKRAIWHRKLLSYADYLRHKKSMDFMYFVDHARGRDCVFYPYAVHNYCLKQVLDRSANAHEIWDMTPRMYSALPHMIGGLAKDRDTPTFAFIESAIEALPYSFVHKLNIRDTRFSDVIDAAEFPIAPRVGMGADRGRSDSAK